MKFRADVIPSISAIELAEAYTDVMLNADLDRPFVPVYYLWDVAIE